MRRGGVRPALLPSRRTGIFAPRCEKIVTAVRGSSLAEYAEQMAAASSCAESEEAKQGLLRFIACGRLWKDFVSGGYWGRSIAREVPTAGNPILPSEINSSEVVRRSG